jgi:hypothetical protein
VAATRASVLDRLKSSRLKAKLLGAGAPPARADRITQPPPPENLIRDALAEDLGKLEDGLELIETEYKLPNPIGGKGFIDILARDRFGLLVVIEVKRSDATARQTIHEIFKYTALLRSNHGIAEDAVRCVVLSADWHELLVPFSEFTASAPYHVDGYKIEVDDEGVCTGLEPVRAIKDAGSLELCPSGLVYLYTTAEEREAHRDEKVRAAGWRVLLRLPAGRLSPRRASLEPGAGGPRPLPTRKLELDGDCWPLPR